MARANSREERGFKYQRRPVETLKERANARGGGFDSIVKAKYKMYKVKDGKNLIRILPPTWDDAKHYGFDLYVNYGIGVDNQSYLSLSKMKGEPDPLAEARRAAEKDGDKDLVKALNPRQRILMWVIDRNAEDEGPMLWACPVSVDKAFAGLAHDEDTKETVWIDDPDEGCDVRFYKEGQGLKTDYPVEKMRILKTSPLHEDPAQAREWTDFIQANPLPECVQFYDYDHIAMMFDGTARVESTATNGEDEKPKKRPVVDEDEEAPRKARRAPVDDDDEVKKPTRSNRGRADDPEDDAEEEVKPRRGRAAPPDDDEEPPFDVDTKPRRGKAPVADDDDDDETVAAKPRSSIRDRINRRGRIEADTD